MNYRHEDLKRLRSDVLVWLFDETELLMKRLVEKGQATPEIMQKLNKDREDIAIEYLRRSREDREKRR